MLKEVNESKFNMWRAVVALVHSDGAAHPEEDAFLNKQFEKIPFSNSQMKTLFEDMKQPKDVNTFFPSITSPGDRAQFIYFARLLFWSDGNFHHQEEEILKSLHQATISKVDLEKVMRSVDTIAEDFARAHKDRGFRTILAEFVERFLS
jgi:uncharacterized membrane protein YebE (DUF533 family)